MSISLRIPLKQNEFTIRALELAVDPTNPNICYLPLGWTIETSADNENFIFLFDKSATHRATLNCETQILCVADDLKKPTSVKVQLDVTMRALRRSQDIIDVMNDRLEIYKHCYWQLFNGVHNEIYYTKTMVKNTQ